MTAPGRSVRLTIPAKPEYITLGRLALTGIAKLQPVSDETLSDLKLALTEACTNSVRHAYGNGSAGAVEIVYELEPDRLVIEVADTGSGFREADLVEESDDLTEGGLGIAIIRSVADELEITEGADGEGSRLRFAKYLAD